MHLLSKLTIASIAFYAFSSVVFAQPSKHEIYYLTDRKAYLIEKFENGLPSLEKEVERESIPHPNKYRDFMWQISGSLPIASKYARPIFEYKIHRFNPSYENRDEFQHMEAEILYEDLFSDVEFSNLSERTIVVIGWIFESQIVDAVVTQYNARDDFSKGQRLHIPERFQSGFPVVWKMEDGIPVDRSPSAVDQLSFREVELGTLIGDVVHERKSSGATALHIAAAIGRIDLAEALIRENKRLVKTPDSLGQVPLSYAARCARPLVCSVLLDAKSPIKNRLVKSDKIKTKLPNASSPFLEGSVDDIQQEEYQFILPIAVESGDFETLKVLTSSKRVNFKIQYEWSLSLAIKNNQEELVSCLLNNGARYRRLYESPEEVVISKFNKGYPELGFLLMEHLKVKPNFSSKGNNLYHAVAPYGDIDLLERIKSLSIDPSQLNDKGLQPAHIAIEFGNIDAICWFIENGGKPIDSGETGVNLVQYAIKTGQNASIECLVGYGYDIKRELRNGVTPLMYAALRREFEIAETLVDLGGVWDIDSPEINRVVLSILNGDRISLLESLFAQGFDRDWKLDGRIDLASLAVFFEAKQIMMSLPNSGSPTFASEVDVEPTATTPPPVLEYPLDLQKIHGDMLVDAKVLVGTNGIVDAVSIHPDVAQDITDIAANALMKTVFPPARINDLPTPYSFSTSVPFKADEIETHVFRLEEVDERPGIVATFEPNFPYRMANSNVYFGEVVLELIVSSDSTVAEVKVLNSSHSGFESSAISWAKMTKWRPAKRNGEPVSSRVRIPVEFRFR